MFKVLVLDILKSGAMAFLFSKVVKAVGQKEISEIIAGSGMVVVSMDVLAILVPGIKVVGDSIDKTTAFFNSIGQFFQSIQNFVGK
jgi:hypothetical protein